MHFVQQPSQQAVQRHIHVSIFIRLCQVVMTTYICVNQACMDPAGREIRAGRAKWEIGIVTTFDAMGP